MRFVNSASEFGFKRAATFLATNVNLLGVGPACLEWTRSVKHRKSGSAFQWFSARRENRFPTILPPSDLPRVRRCTPAG